MSTRQWQSAKRGFEIWRNTPAPARGDVLRRVGDLMSSRKDEIADLMTREMGKPLQETRGDVQEGIDTAYYAATEGRRLFGHTVPSELQGQMGDELPPADRRLRAGDAVQLSDGDSDVEDVSGTAVRKRRDLQTGRGCPAHRRRCSSRFCSRLGSRPR